MADPALELDADVLIIGGGLAGTWAAAAAARSGASVILADKGYCGVSGVTAAAGPGHWWVAPEKREQAIEQRDARAFGLADRRWMARILDQTWRSLPTLAKYYDFSRDEQGAARYRALRGPEYMRAMRALVTDLGVIIMDQSPALELLLHKDGSTAGARGIRRQKNQPWTVRAGGTVLATGGCAFLSKLLGANTNTGDGYLMGAEAGADLSGMEFSSYYTVAPLHSNMTRAMSYAFARYFDETGQEIETTGVENSEVVAKALLKGKVYCSLERMPEDIRALLPQISPNFLLPFVRSGIDPFHQKFEVTLRAEGTVRGIGGLRIINDECETSVRGLFAAGDAATRELIAGATSGGGAQNSSWALSSGQWAGEAAARRARSFGRRSQERANAVGEAGLSSPAPKSALDTVEAIASLQSEMLPVGKNLFRTGHQLIRSLEILDGLWREVRAGITAPNPVRAREAAAMVASARWCYRAGLARAESRGMHKRTDIARIEPMLGHRLRVGGLDQVWTRSELATITAEAV